MLNIQRKLTPYNFTDKNDLSRIKYIVIHYCGATGTAKNNVDYFASKYIGASAHYFVDEKSIWQCVDDADASWHCGGGLQGNSYHQWYKKCLNSNSIGIEMCVKKTAAGQWYFEPGTVTNTLDLVKYLMAKYNVPLANVIRHADVTGKMCPEPYSYSAAHDKAWEDFKAALNGGSLFKVTDTDLIGKVINCDSLNVRSGPSTNYTKIASLAAGDTVWIDGICENGWYRANFTNGVGVAYFSSDYIEIQRAEVKHSYDPTVNNLVTDGITTAENVVYWERVLSGAEAPKPEFVRALFDRYHAKLG